MHKNYLRRITTLSDSRQHKTLPTFFFKKLKKHQLVQFKTNDCIGPTKIQ